VVILSSGVPIQSGGSRQPGRGKTGRSGAFPGRGQQLRCGGRRAGARTGRPTGRWTSLVDRGVDL